MGKCPNCNSDLISEIKGLTLTISCTNCDWGLASTYWDPIYTDETIYKVILEKGNLSSIENIKAIAKVVNCNFLQAKKIIESENPIIVEDNAPEIIIQVRKLNNSSLKYSITPNFPYTDKINNGEKIIQQI